MKRIGTSHCYFRGSESRNDLIAVDADLLVLDEYDSLDAAHIPEAERRISGSELGLIRRVGVPSAPEFGIAKLYDDSDQRRWHVTCNGCSRAQSPTFDANVRWEEDEGIVMNARIVCNDCEEPLDVRNGEWIAQYPNRARPGFHVHRLLVPGANLVPLVEASKKRGPHLTKSFFNNDLGLPYTENTGGLDRVAIAAAISAGASHNGGVPLTMVQFYDGDNYVTAGIDVASARALHVRISEHLSQGLKRALFIGTADGFAEVAQILDRYSVNFACVDAAPEGRLSLYLASNYPGRVYLARYANQFEPFVVDIETQTISAARTIMLDETIEMMRSQRNLLPADLPDEYVEHMIAPRRRITTDQYDRKVARYESRRADDYFHAEVYDLLATMVAMVRLEMARMTERQYELVPIHEVVDFEPSNLADSQWADEIDYHEGFEELNEYEYFDDEL